MDLAAIRKLNQAKDQSKIKQTFEGKENQPGPSESG